MITVVAVIMYINYILAVLQIGLTALHKACETDSIAIVKYLIAAGCNQVIDAQTTVRLGVYHCIIRL